MSKSIIVVPCYNEEKRINKDAFQSFANKVPDIAFLFVNDGSTDLTANILSELCSETCFTLYNLSTNMGKAEAIRRGILKALEFGPNYVGMWDADLATPLDEILRLQEILDLKPEVQMVFAARVKLMGRTIERPAARHYFGRLAATLISWTLGLPIYDTQCGAKLFRANQECKALFLEPFVSSWIFDVELVARLIAQNKHHKDLIEKAIYELPLNEWRHQGGSKIKGSDYLRALGELYRIWRKYLQP